MASHISAGEIAQKVRTGRLSAEAVASDALAHAEATHSDLNAFTFIDPSAVAARAKAIDVLVARGQDPGPLAGVPIALKDLIDDAGVPNTRGSSLPAVIPESSAACVRRIGAAGGVIIGRTGLHEFAFGFSSENPWFGPVRNPWDLSRSPGGSSGGSGTAVAAGITPIGIGTDTGGSVRVPAALCGVMGLKVTHGRIPTTGVFPLVESLDTVGPIARTVGDLALAYSVMAGDEPSDPWSVPVPVASTHHVLPSDITLIVGVDLEDEQISTSVATDFESFLQACVNVGVSVEHARTMAAPPMRTLVDAIAPEILRVHDAQYTQTPDRYGEDVAARIERARHADPKALADALRWAAATRAEIARSCSGGYTAIVTPTVAASSKVIGRDEMDLGGRTIFYRDALSRFSAPINRVGVPALSVPLRKPDGGFGESVQLIGPMWSESMLLSIGLALESAVVVASGTPPYPFRTTDDAAD